MADNEFYMDEAAVYELLNSRDGPVGWLMEELSAQVVAVARARVRVRKAVWDIPVSRNTAFPPGYTLASIRSNVHYYQGLIYGGAAAVEDPTVYLENPAEQMEAEYPFITTGLDSLVL